MASTTKNLGLILQDQTELYDINIVNENLEKIDTAIGKIADAINIKLNEEESGNNV